MKITKIKFKDGRVELEYNVDIKIKNVEGFETQTNELALKSTEKPAPEFDAALQALAEDVCEILELPEDYINGITVTGVSFSYSSGVMGAVITAKKTLKDSNSPFNLNTPFKPSKVYNEGAPEDNLLSSDTVAKLEYLMTQAEYYIEGRRAQIRLEEVLKEADEVLVTKDPSIFDNVKESA